MAMSPFLKTHFWKMLSVTLTPEPMTPKT